MVLVHGGVLLGWYRFTDLDHAWLLVPLAFQLVAVVLFSANTLAAVLKRTQTTFQAVARAPSTLRAILLLPVDYGLLCLSFVFWGAVQPFAVLYAALLTLNALILCALLVKWFGELCTEDQRVAPDEPES